MEKQNGALLWNIEKIVSKGDYLYAIVRDHPKATKHGYVLEHRVAMENHLGRLLSDSEVVHHVNGDRHDNRIENLRLYERSEHTRKHLLARGKMWVDLKCPWCEKEFSRPRNKTQLGGHGTLYTTCSIACRGKFGSMVRLRKETKQVEDAISGNIISVYRLYPDGNREEID